MLESAALQQFHGNKSLAFAFIDFIDGADIGMVESRCRTCFAAKTFETLRIVGYIFRQELQSHGSAQTGVFRLIHHAHSTATKLLKNPIVRDGLANHRRKSYVGKISESMNAEPLAIAHGDACRTIRIILTTPESTCQLASPRQSGSNLIIGSS